MAAGLLYSLGELVFSLMAYLKVLRVWSAEVEPGLIQAIITIFELSSFRNESLRTMVSLEALKGTWLLFMSKALIHSLRAKRDLLISAPSILLYLLLD